MGGQEMSLAQWTNRTVIRFAAGGDPVAAMENRARALVLQALDAGWTGPPFDPLAMAQLLHIETTARRDIADTRLVPVSKTAFRIEYNPDRARGRLRFSIAHRIAQTFFPDYVPSARAKDDWQLDVLCNIGAAELLMPSGSFTSLASRAVSIESVLQLRREFDVSVEACLIRLIKLSRKPVAAFCASVDPQGVHKLDYVIPAAGWPVSVGVGTQLPERNILTQIAAVGDTVLGDESWTDEGPFHIECVGLAPYPGQVHPRIVGLLTPLSSRPFEPPALNELKGDALSPIANGGARIIAHVVSNTPAPWRGEGFAAQVRERFPSVWDQYRLVVNSAGGSPQLGSTFIGQLARDTLIVHMVAQQALANSDTHPLRYAAYAQCLIELRQIAEQRQASVHMPRIEAGDGGANWDLVRELIVGELVNHHVETTVYQPPS